MFQALTLWQEWGPFRFFSNVRRQKLVRARPSRRTTSIAAPTDTQRYQLRQRRQPRYKRGTCGLRDCVCVLVMNENRRVPFGARVVSPEGIEKANLVQRLTIRAEKTYSAVKRSAEYPVEEIMQKLLSSKVAKAPCPRFKQWCGPAMGEVWNSLWLRWYHPFPVTFCSHHSTVREHRCRWYDA